MKTDEKLYQSVKMQICRRIYDGTYQDGEPIPPERTLCEDLGVSRVTLRRSLQMLQDEHLIERVQGSGTRIAMSYGAHAGDMDVITLVAPAQNPFFSKFIDVFQTKADEAGSLVLYKQKQPHTSLDDCLFRIYNRDLRNIVLWLEDTRLEEEGLRKLRGLGMNFVLFDTARASAYADSVCMDNELAIRSLYEGLRARGCRKIGYVGWDTQEVGNIRIREACCRELAGGEETPVCRVPWTYHNHLELMEREEMMACLKPAAGCDGLLYGVGDFALPFEALLREQGIAHTAAMVDRVAGAERFGIDLVAEQDFAAVTDRIFECLQRQNDERSGWAPAVYRIPPISS